MSFKKTLALGALLAASIVYLNQVYFPAEKKRLSAGKAFEELRAGSIENIVVSKAAGSAGEPAERYELVRGAAKDVMPSAASGNSKPVASDEGAEESEGPVSSASDLKGWGLSSIKGAAVDTTTLSTFISTLGGLNLGDAIESDALEKDLSVYGLDKPQLTVAVKLPNKEAVELSFGKRNDYLNQRYIKATGRDGVFLVDDSTFITLNKGMVELREKTPIQFQDPDVRSVEIVTPDITLTLSQKTVGEWLVKGRTLDGSEREFKASTSEVGDLLRAIKDFRVADFKDGEVESEANGLKNPRVVANIGFREGVSPSSLSVRVGKVGGKSGDTSGEDSGTIFFTYSGAPGVMTTLADTLSSKKISIDSLREKKLFNLASSEVSKVSVTGKDYSPVELFTDGIDWKVNGKVADPVFADDVVANILSLEVDSYIYSGATPDFSTPSRRYEILKKGTASDTIVLLLVEANKGDGKSGGAASWFGKIEGGTEVFSVKDDAVRKASPREETLLMATPTPSASPTVSG